MGIAELYLNPQPYCFGGSCVDRDRAHAYVLGVPFDATTSYRPGAREAPLAIRYAASNIEFYSIRVNVDLEEHPIADLGDLVISYSIEETLRRLRMVIEEFARDNKPLVVLGGEHTITLGIYEGLFRAGFKPCILVLDAHLDFREEFQGTRLNHATFARRLAEKYGIDKLIHLGIRAVSREEIDYARRNRAKFLTSHQIRLLGIRETYRRVIGWLKAGDCSSLHISIDMDVYDPAYAPGVSNPEPDGLEPWMVLELLTSIVRDSPIEVKSIDIVEVSPPYDVGSITSVLAAKTAAEALSAIIARKQTRGGEQASEGDQVFY